MFARVLGASGYGDLAVLLSSFIIMMVPGSALQIAAAREVSHDLAEGNPNPGAGVRRWLERLVVATVVVARGRDARPLADRRPELDQEVRQVAREGRDGPGGRLGGEGSGSVHGRVRGHGCGGDWGVARARNPPPALLS